jgi:hypothetical protein
MGLPAAITGLSMRPGTIAPIVPAATAATTPAGRFAPSSITRRILGPVRRRRMVVRQESTVVGSSGRSDATAGGPARVESGTAVAHATPRWTGSSPTPPRRLRGGVPPAGRADRARGADLPVRRLPLSIGHLLPSERPAHAVASIGSGRRISPACTAATAGPVGSFPAAGLVTSGRNTPAPRQSAVSQDLRRSHSADIPYPPAPGLPVPAEPTRAQPIPESGTVDPTRSTPAATASRIGPGATPFTAPTEPDLRARTAGLLLRQAIPTATSIAAASSATIRRMPPAPPMGTPRLGSHRQLPRGAGPGAPPSADPRWSFAAVGATGERSLTGATIGARTRGSRTVTLPAPSTNPAAPSTDPAAESAPSSRRASLLDLVPPSLFDRARAGLAASGSGWSTGAQTNADRFAVRPPGLVATGTVPNTEVAQVTQPTDNGPVPRQQIAEALTPREWDELVDVIVDRLEERVLDELARRGRRFTPGVF